MSNPIEVTLVRTASEFRVENENGYAHERTTLGAARLAMNLLRNAGAEPTERLYCDVLSALNLRASLIDVTVGETAFEIHAIKYGGTAEEAWDAPREGAPCPTWGKS